MTCSEIITKLKQLKKRIEFLEERRNDKGKVYKRIYNEDNLKLFYESLESEYGSLIQRKYWDKIDVIIEKLKNPDLEELGAFPFKKKFLENL